MTERYLHPAIQADLREKMVFLGGPRQVGKTTLARQFLKNAREDHPAYLNWDFPEDRPRLLQPSLPANEPLLIWDEIHKYKGWRNLVKGLYDKYKGKRRFLITGSARLDYYRRGGDSLQGRYHYHRLHPFSLPELGKTTSRTDIETLLRFGGFPEPLFKANGRHWKRWQRERITRVLHEDLISLENVKELSQVDLLAQILPARVGSPLSVNNLKQDLAVAFETAERWVLILERLYVCYRIGPYGPAPLRAAKKEKKLYMWDWSLCTQPGARFENMIASHLLKYCHFMEDTEGDRMDLNFLRDDEKREIDFVVLKNRRPLFAVECKTGEKSLSPAIHYFAARTEIPIFYQVHMGKRDEEMIDSRARFIPFAHLCREVGLI